PWQPGRNETVCGLSLSRSRADPVPPRHLAGHLPGVGRRGRPGTPAVPAVRVRRRPPRHRRPPPMATDQPASVKWRTNPPPGRGGTTRARDGADPTPVVQGRANPPPVQRPPQPRPGRGRPSPGRPVADPPPARARATPHPT